MTKCVLTFSVLTENLCENWNHIPRPAKTEINGSIERDRERGREKEWHRETHREKERDSWTAGGRV